jgi:hypothetical protein
METIYTIPINEAFDHAEGCPFCRIRERLEEESLEYALGAAMMEPGVRQRLNRAGFCRTHFRALSQRKGKLALALILETRFDELLRHGETALTDSCFICERVDAFEAHCISNAAAMFAHDPAFPAKVAAQPYFCLPHLRQSLVTAKRQLKRKQFEQYRSALLSVVADKLKALKTDARKFADSFDYRNSGIALGDERNVFANTEPLF